jgi:hypothetical protein
MVKLPALARFECQREQTCRPYSNLLRVRHGRRLPIPGVNGRLRQWLRLLPNQKGPLWKSKETSQDGKGQVPSHRGAGIPYLIKPTTGAASRLRFCAPHLPACGGWGRNALKPHSGQSPIAGHLDEGVLEFLRLGLSGPSEAFLGKFPVFLRCCHGGSPMKRLPTDNLTTFGDWDLYGIGHKTEIFFTIKLGHPEILIRTEGLELGCRPTPARTGRQGGIHPVTIPDLCKPQSRLTMAPRNCGTAALKSRTKDQPVGDIL